MHSTLVIIISLFLIGCSKITPDAKKLSDDEYAVYSAVILKSLDYYLSSSVFNIDSSSMVNVFHNTVRGNIIGERQYSIFHPKISENDTGVSLKRFSKSGEWDSLVSNFKHNAKDTVNINCNQLMVPLKCIPFVGYPSYRPVFYFSRVGFNSKRNEALVYFRYSVNEDGGDFIVLLSKGNNTWRVVQGYGQYFYGGEYDYFVRNLIAKPTVGTSHPIPTATIQYGDSTANAK
jgi:hypothetical protein